MYKILKMNINDLEEGAILANDLYVENRLLMKKESVLTSRVISILKNRNVQYASIKTAVSNEDIHVETSNSLNLTSPQTSKDSVPSIQEDFFTALAALSIEKRYGYVLSNAEDINYVKNLFCNILANPSLYTKLNQLKTWDFYSYLHSIDVFILSTLFAKKQALPNLASIAVGFLFHDIGKLTIPLSILQKPGKLTVNEFNLMETHTTEGYTILCQLEFQSIAYLAKSHHERINGIGYPQHLKEHAFNEALKILQIIDVYSALTLKRVYREIVDAADALTLIYRDENTFDSDLLARFVDFIGIYPKNAIVLLSDKTHALIDQTNEQFPLLPLVKRLENNTSFYLPLDYHLTIKKMISYQTESTAQLLNMFYTELVSGDFVQAHKTCLKLTDNFKMPDYFTKIFIPTFQIVNVLVNQKGISEVRYKEITSYLMQLLDHKLHNLADNNLQKKSIILLVEKDFQHSYLFKIVMGLLHIDSIYPFVLDTTTNEADLASIAKYAKATSICLIADQSPTVVHKSTDLAFYHLDMNQTEKFVLNFLGDNKSLFNIKEKIQNYTHAH